ncbi:MAG TPA: hypothetical protein DDW42_09215 [Desulfobacteraceae bacterium]|nr:hypothetical protein [Desulfobacteraceae bacterium]
MRFVVDTMLGKLAKWLRVMGYDTIYQGFYRPHEIAKFVKEGRILLSRHRKTTEKYTNTVLIHHNHVGEQLSELEMCVQLRPDRSNLFTRCLICNSILKEAQADKAVENVPEYVFYQNTTGIRFCPSCGRHFWPGTHRKNMEKQLEDWGF